MAPKMMVVIPLNVVDAIMTFVVSLSFDDSYNYFFVTFSLSFTY